jgi:hypothetical protein
VNLFADMGVQPASLQNDLAPATASTERKAPVSKVTWASEGDVLSGETVTIRGTSRDTGGVVGGVEVSVDGGRTWRPAQLGEEWTYEWTIPAAAARRSS